SEAIVVLQDACFAIDDTYREVNSEILGRWSDPNIHVATDSLLGVTDEGEVIASVWSIVPTVAETKWRAFGSNYVHPEHRSDEVLTFVLDWWETRSRQRISQKSGDLPGVLSIMTYEQEEQQLRFLQQHGFAISRYFDEMFKDLSVSLPDKPLPSGISLVPADEAHEGDELMVHNASFGDHWGSQPFSQERWDLLKDEFYLPDASYVAYDGDTPVGHIMCAKYPHDFEGRGFSHSWVEGLGVVRSHRKQGLASAMIAIACKQFVADGMEFAAIGVDAENPTGAYGLYEDLGFVQMRRSMSMQKRI
ncbi:MAG: GNAT family N-acetyltransferase, partial [Acidimicrobiia bacterium]